MKNKNSINLKEETIKMFLYMSFIILVLALLINNIICFLCGYFLR
jgi:hypothetical protein